MIKWTGYLLYYTIVPYHAHQAALYLLISWPLVDGTSMVLGLVTQNFYKINLLSIFNKGISSPTLTTAPMYHGGLPTAALYGYSPSPYTLFTSNLNLHHLAWLHSRVGVGPPAGIIQPCQETAVNQASLLKAARAKAPRVVVQIQVAGVLVENCTKF